MAGAQHFQKSKMHTEETASDSKRTILVNQPPHNMQAARKRKHWQASGIRRLMMIGALAHA